MKKPNRVNREGNPSLDAMEKTLTNQNPVVATYKVTESQKEYFRELGYQNRTSASDELRKFLVKHGIT